MTTSDHKVIETRLAKRPLLLVAPQLVHGNQTSSIEVLSYLISRTACCWSPLV